MILCVTVTTVDSLLHVLVPRLQLDAVINKVVDPDTLQLRRYLLVVFFDYFGLM